MEIPELIDTHCHLDLKPLCYNVETFLKRARQRGIDKVVTIGINPQSSQTAVELSEKYQDVYAAVGIHPHDSSNADEEAFSSIEELLSRDKVVALGEIGLDYFKQYSPIEIQKKAFKKQLGIARERGKPVVIHARNSYEDVLQILRHSGIGEGGAVIHCFSGSIEAARQALDLGCYISFTGVITFKNASDLKDVVRFVPLDHILLETDAPFLAPEPFRGKTNEPAFLNEIAAAVAKIKGVSEEELIKCTTLNAKEFFSLQDP